MCRSKAEGGRRCPGKSRKAEQENPDLTTGDSSTTTLTRPPRGAHGSGGSSRPLTPQKPLTPKTGGTTVGREEPRPAETPDGLNPETPTYNQLLTTPAEEWFQKPWRERKAVAEEATREVIAVTGSPASFRGWSKSRRTLGKAWIEMNRFTGEETRSIELSDLANRHKEPVTIADTIAHEVAHTLASRHAGHGPEWVEKFNGVKQQVGLTTEHASAHKATEREQAEAVKAYIAKKANAPWKGECPQGHSFAAGRKPTRGHLCVQCRQKGLDADITYERNTNRGGKK